MLKQLLNKNKSISIKNKSITNSTIHIEQNVIYENVYTDITIKLEKVLLDKTFFSICQNWSKNRPPDNVRINDIAKYYCNNNEHSMQVIPGIIYAWNNPEQNDKGIVIYDGIHRLLAAKEYIQQSKKKLWCLLQTTTTKNEEQIVKDFVNLNKSVCVPTIFLDESDVIKKLMCQSVADIMCKRYPTFVSPSRKPYSYNFNRDNLIEFVSTLNINFHIKSIDTKIVNEMMGLNVEAKDFVDRHKIKYPNKCLYHKFFLFFLDKSFIKQKIEDAINMST